MRKLLFSSVIVPLLVLFSLFPGSFRIAARSFPPSLDGSMMPYDFSAVDSLPSFPEGYRPVHISYLARHGARFLSSPAKIRDVEKYLYEAARHRNLSPGGDAFFGLLRSVADSTNGRWGLLSPVGIAEEERLGTDMARWFPGLLKAGKVCDIATYVPRVIMTMYQFNHSLERRHTRLELYSSAGRQYDSLLRCFAVPGPYCEFRDSGRWKEVYDDFVDRHITAAPARRLVKVADDTDSLRLKRLTMAMFGILQSSRAAGFEAEASRWFTYREYAACLAASNLNHWLRNTPTPVDASAAEATAPLVSRIITDADAALSDSTALAPVLSGYFGHAETLLPFLSTVGIPGCFEWTTDYEAVASHWHIQEITPLGANFMIIFLRSDDPGKEVLTALRLNGRNVPAFPEAPLFLPWNELKAHWRQRITSF